MADPIVVINQQGISLPLEPAGPLVRAYAWLIDLLWRVLIFALALFLISFANMKLYGLILILWFAMDWIYPVWFEVLHQGMTPGKKRMGIRVVDASGAQIGLAASMIRNLLRVVDFLPMLYAVGLFSQLLDSRFRRLGDLVAHTLVIYHEGQHSTPNFTTSQQTLDAPNLTLALEPEQIQALKAFGDRHHCMTRERQQELAKLLDGIEAKASCSPADLLRIGQQLRQWL